MSNIVSGPGGLDDVLMFPQLANDGEPGEVYSVTVGSAGDTYMGLRDGAIQIRRAYEGAPGLFTGLVDYDGMYYPRMVGGVKEDLVRLPVYAKRVKDIYGNYWSLADLAGKGGEWQSAVLAKCVIEPAADDGSSDEKAIFLRLYTERNGDTLVFELASNMYYSSGV